MPASGAAHPAADPGYAPAPSPRAIRPVGQGRTLHRCCDQWGVSSPRAGFQIEQTFGQESALGYLLFLQNGMGKSLRSMLTSLRITNLFKLTKDDIPGTVDEVAESLLASPSARPHFLAGIVSHGIYKSGPFTVVHAGVGNITLGALHSRSTPPITWARRRSSRDRARSRTVRISASLSVSPQRPSFPLP